MDAVEWYRGFIAIFQDKEGYAEFGDYKGRWDSDDDWTGYIEAKLTNWGKAQGFEVVPDFDNPTRIDMLWKKDGEDVVAIEHENAGNSVLDGNGTEIEKLLNRTTAPLRVLITYFPDTKFPSKAGQLKDKLLSQLGTKKKKEFAFLLLVAPYEIWDAHQYAAYSFRPTFQAEFLPPPYA